MKQNVGSREQLFRIGIGSVALAGAALLPKLRGLAVVDRRMGLSESRQRIDAELPEQPADGHRQHPRQRARAFR